MPWEKSFCTDDALDRAAEVFCAKGYEGSSMTDLTKGMGINKGSLYNAFGSKKDLFKAVLNRFSTDHQGALLTQLEALDNPVAAIAMLFDNIIAQSLGDFDRKGSLLMTTALELPNHDPDVREIVTGAIRQFEEFLLGRIEMGQGSGQIPADLDAKQTAKALVALAGGLRLLARGTYDASSLVAVKAQGLRLIGQ